MLHVKDLAVVNDYEIYLECHEGYLEEERKVVRPMKFREFCDNLLEIMMS